MFKLNTDLTNPTATPRSFTLEQLFDPRVHIVPPDFHITRLNFISFLQRIFTRENIITHPKLFFPRLTSVGGYGFGHHFDAAAYIAPIPDDQLWVLFFWHTGRVDSAQFERVFINPYVSIDSSDVSYTPPLRAIYNYDSTTHRSPCSYKSTDWPTFINPLITQTIENINSRIVNHTRHGDTPLLFTNELIPFVRHIIYYYYDQAIYVDPNDILTRSSVERILHQIPTTRIKVTESPFTVKLHNPVTSTNRSTLYRTLSYSTNPLDLLDWPIILTGEHNPLLYGVELEMSSDYDQRTLVDAAKDPFFILKSDSSVSGSRSHPYELCTIPMSFKAHRQQWAYWFKNLDYTQFDQTKDTTNGMHVHISRDAFTQDHLRRFSWFFTQPAHQDFMMTVSERDSRSFNEYSKLPNYPNERVKSYLNTLDYAARVRGCVNLSSKNTVEVRLFRGIVSLAEILKNLEFVDSIYHFTQDANYHQLALDNYYAWLLKTNRNRYSLLKKYFEQIPNFDFLLASADIHRIIHTERKPRTILERVQKSMIQITNTHVTVLNRIFKKRIFILDKDTGKLRLSDHNHGKLAFLDRSLEARLLRNSPPTAQPQTPVVTEAAPEPIPIPTPTPAARRRRTRTSAAPNPAVTTFTFRLAEES